MLLTETESMFGTEVIGSEANIYTFYRTISHMAQRLNVRFTHSMQYTNEGEDIIFTLKAAGHADDILQFANFVKVERHKLFRDSPIEELAPPEEVVQWALATGRHTMGQILGKSLTEIMASHGIIRYDLAIVAGWICKVLMRERLTLRDTSLSAMQDAIAEWEGFEQAQKQFNQKYNISE